MKKLIAFTLAEVLITLGVIGVVAAMTIPTMMQNMQDQAFKTAYKKAFSVATNAFKMGTVDGSNYSPMLSTMDGPSACLNWQIFSSQFIKAKECINNNNDQCWNMTTGAETSNGAPIALFNGFIDNSGMSWSMRGDCTTTASYNVSFFLVDTNGLKGPNKYGKDRWAFSWVLDGVSSGVPIKIFLLQNRDYTPGQTDTWVCPTGPCYYQSWLINEQ